MSITCINHSASCGWLYEWIRHYLTEITNIVSGWCVFSEVGLYILSASATYRLFFGFHLSVSLLLCMSLFNALGTHHNTTHHNTTHHNTTTPHTTIPHTTTPHTIIPHTTTPHTTTPHTTTPQHHTPQHHAPQYHAPQYHTPHTTTPHTTTPQTTIPHDK